MRIDLQAFGFDLTYESRKKTERRLQFVFSWAVRDFRVLSVGLSDASSPHGGNCKQCRIQLLLADMPEIAVDDVEADLDAAIDRAVDRTERILTCRLERLHEQHHGYLSAMRQT